MNAILRDRALSQIAMCGAGSIKVKATHGAGGGVGVGGWGGLGGLSPGSRAGSLCRGKSPLC